jgi:hypothetical protein
MSRGSSQKPFQEIIIDPKNRSKYQTSNFSSSGHHQKQ